MKKFEAPELNVEVLEIADVITTSGKPECGEDWELPE